MGNLFATSNWSSVPEEGAPEGEPVVESTPENTTNGAVPNTGNRNTPKNNKSNTPNGSTVTQNTNQSSSTPNQAANTTNQVTSTTNQVGNITNKTSNATKDNKSSLAMKGGRRKKRKTRRSNK